MMTKSDFVRNKKLVHFANIVKLALVDGVVTDEEQELLEQLAERFKISQKTYAEIMKNPDSYSIKPPVTLNERIERLYNLTEMIFIDEEIVSVEVDLLQKIEVELGFPKELIEKISKKAIHLIINNYNLNDFSLAIQTIYKE